jgi:hypothetical protein
MQPVQRDGEILDAVAVDVTADDGFGGGVRDAPLVSENAELSIKVNA